jgi:hypothetical protein
MALQLTALPCNSLKSVTVDLIVCYSEIRAHKRLKTSPTADNWIPRSVSAAAGTLAVRTASV